MADCEQKDERTYEIEGIGFDSCAEPFEDRASHVAVALKIRWKLYGGSCSVICR